MAIVTETFAPDTCTCVVVLSYDDALPDNQKLYSLASVTTRGNEHQRVKDRTLLSVLQEELHRRDAAVSIAAQVSGLQPSQVWWSFTGGRTLRLSFDPHLHVPQSVKAAIQTQCDYQLGVGKVQV